MRSQSFQRGLIFLAPAPQRAVPKPEDVIAESGKGVRVGWNGVIGEIASHDAS